MIHKSLTIEKWRTLTLAEQLANVGMDVDRAIRWKKRGNKEITDLAVERVLELLHLTIEANKTMEGLRELTRLREVLVAYFFEQNEYNLTETSIEKYFLSFSILARRHT